MRVESSQHVSLEISSETSNDIHLTVGHTLGIVTVEETETDITAIA